MESTNEALRYVRAAVGESGERSDEFADTGRSLGLGTHRVGRFVARVVVNQDEQVLETAVLCSRERSRDVGVDQTANV
eukprot:592716-Pleurochrysis_carterae.AAC.1